MRILSAGDAVLVVEFEERIDPAISARGAALAQALAAEHVPGVRDVVPTYRSVAVYFDPLRVDRKLLGRRLEELSASSSAVDVGRRDPVRIPVCYGGEYGPDLPGIAKFAGVSEDEAVTLHSRVR